MGYCGYGSFHDAYASMSNLGQKPSDSATNEGKVLTDTYMDPDLVAQQCLPHLAKDLAMLFMLGSMLRILTYVLLAFKGARK